LVTRESHAFYTVIDYGNGEFSASFTYRGYGGQRGFYIPDAGTLAKSLQEANALCAEHHRSKAAV
jgi:hypothetical protein